MPRRYTLRVRAETAERTRRRVLDAARANLLAGDRLDLNVGDVAAAASVARSTVYAIFGSRAGLVGAVADDSLTRTGLTDVIEAYRLPDPVAALEKSLRASCRMYAADRALFARLLALALVDPDAAGPVAGSQADRAGAMEDLATRLAAAGRLRPTTDVRRAADVLSVLTSFWAFDELSTGRGMSADDAADTLIATARATVILEAQAEDASVTRAPGRRVRRVTRRLVTGAEVVADAITDAVTDTALRGRRALPNLYEVRPEARNAPVRELGLLSIPVDEVVGTAVEGEAQRGPDFKPLPGLRTRNWTARWRRLKAAGDRLAVLPPIDVLRTSDGYWVTDGHNRVALARDIGQVEIDAAVKAVMLPGEPVVRPAGPLAPLLVDADRLQAAGRGELTPGATVVHGLSVDAGAAAADGDEPSGSSADPGPTEREAGQHGHVGSGFGSNAHGDDDTGSAR